MGQRVKPSRPWFRTALIVISLANAWSPEPAVTESESDSAFETLTFSAEQLFYSFDWKTLWSESQTIMASPTLKLETQNLVFDLDHWLLKAWGAVRLSINELSLTGDEILIAFKQGQFVIRKYGETIVEDCYRIPSSEPTACNDTALTWSTAVPDLASELLKSLLAIEAEEIVISDQARLRCTPAVLHTKGVIYPPLPKLTFTVGELPIKRGLFIDRFGIGTYRGIETQASVHYAEEDVTGSLGVAYESGLKNADERNLVKGLWNHRLQLSDEATFELAGWADNRKRYALTPKLVWDRSGSLWLTLLGKFIDELYGSPRQEVRFDGRLTATPQTDITLILATVLNRNWNGTFQLDHKLTGRLTTGLTTSFIDTFASSFAHHNRSGTWYVGWQLTKFSARLDYQAAWDSPQNWRTHGPGLTLSYRSLLLPPTPITLVVSDSFQYEARDWDQDYWLATNTSQFELTTGRNTVLPLLNFEQKLLVAHLWTIDREQSLATDYTLFIDLSLPGKWYAMITYLASGLWDADFLPGLAGSSQQLAAADLGIGAPLTHLLNAKVTWDLELNSFASIALDGTRQVGRFWEAQWRFKYDLSRESFLEHQYQLTRTFRTFNLGIVVDVKAEDLYVTLVSAL